MSGPQSSLRMLQDIAREPDPARSFAAQREAFHKHGVVCLSLEEAERRLGWAAARQLRNIGEQAFGKLGV